MKNSRHVRTAPVVCMLLSVLATSSALAANRIGAPVPQRADEVEVFVRLATPSVAELNIDSIRRSGAIADRAAQRAQVVAVEVEQAAFRQRLAGTGARELSALQVGANGLRVRVRASELDAIKTMPGVRSVGRVEQLRLSNIDSVPSIGAPQVWERLRARGEGVTIAIIDSGVDYLHANFGGPGTAEAYAANDKNVIEPGTFPNAKVIGGWDFAGATYNASDPESVPQPDPDPLDGNGHGSHVAGSAAGFGVSGIIGSGVAPEAKIYALKVFNDTSGTTNVASDAIEWALDPNADGDMSDRVDVINMSLGAAAGDPLDPTAITAQNAAELGVIVVAASGNAGATPYITDSPGVSNDVISVAAVTPSGRLFSRVNVTAPAVIAGIKENLEGGGPVQLRNLPPISDQLVESMPLNACAPLTNGAAVSGNIVLAVRGVCDFVVKFRNAQDAGARAIIVYNDGANSGRIAPFVMGGIDETILIPGVMVNFPDGAALNTHATADAASPVTVTLDVAANPALDDQIAAFSSRGPGHGGSGFKPDVSAPGVAIVSTAVGTGNRAASIDGTSMSTPHVAGAAALLRQLHPDLDQSGIKALLQNSAVSVNPSSETSLARQGTGTIRVSAAAELTSYAAPGGVSFGRLNPVDVVHKTRQITLRNLANRARHFSVTHEAQQAYPGVTVHCPSSVIVGRHRAQRFSIHLEFDPHAAGAAGVFDTASISQSEVDGWCVLSDGEDTLRVGYLAVVDAASQVTVTRTHSGNVHRLHNSGPASGLAEAFTWVAQGAGDDDDDDDTAGALRHTFDAIGVRSNELLGFPVIELAVTFHERFEHVSNVRVELYLDANNDGTEEYQLVADDLSVFSPGVDAGTYVSAQFELATGQGFLDWNVTGWDFNDRALIIPFTRLAGGGFVPDRFSYRLRAISRDGSVDTERGTIDLSRELSPDLNSFVLDPRVSAEVRASGPAQGRLLWLFQNNRLGKQESSAQIRPTP